MTVIKDRRAFVDELKRRRDERQQDVDRLIARRNDAKAAVRRITEKLEARGATQLEVKMLPHHKAAVADAEALTADIDQAKADVAAFDERIADQEDDVERLDGPGLTDSARRVLGKAEGEHTAGHLRRGGTEVELRSWARRAADQIQSMRGESRAMTSGQIDVPNLVEPNITPMARPNRLTDLLVSRKALSGNAFEYFRQTVRTNNASTVADLATKPTSVLTTTAVSDRARVVAHLSEQTPARLLADVDALQTWLITEMAEGVLDQLEYQAIQGDGTGENFTGVLHVAGTRAVAFATDVVTTLRKGLTLMQSVGEVPNAVVLSPADAEAVDLTRWGASGGFLTEGFATGVAPGNDPSSNNIFGPGLQRVISPSIPTGTAVLADWTKVALYIRESVNVLFDFSGDNFVKNAFIARGEGRFGLGWLRPSSFAICDLTA
jgi:HK97 family phage major capsid protein